jgi:hypothetical protein
MKIMVVIEDGICRDVYSTEKADVAIVDIDGEVMDPTDEIRMHLSEAVQVTDDGMTALIGKFEKEIQKKRAD